MVSPFAAGLEAVRAVQTIADDQAGLRLFGSGYLVTSDLVLTAEHVLHGAAEVSVRFVNGLGQVREVGAQVVFSSAAADVAVLRLVTLEQRVPLVAFGYLAGPTACEVLGFPRFKLNDDHKAARVVAGLDPDSRWLTRDSEHVRGSCASASNRYAGTLALTVPVPGRDPDPASSPWEGMAGAAVFAGGLLIGLVAEHHRSEGLGGLTATAVQQWPHLLDPQSWQQLQNLLGMAELVAVPGARMPLTPASSVRSLPRDVPAFIGRTADLDRLERLLDASGGGVLAVHTVDGMAGVGKSAFAIHAAHRLASRFPDGQMFLPLHGHTPGQEPLDVAAGLDALLAADGLTPAELPKTVEGKQALWRHRTADRRMVLVLDDAAYISQVAPLLPAAPHTLVLVTSRRPLSGLSGAIPIRLDVLEPDSAAALLACTAARPGLTADDPDVQVLAELCGHLPLALTLIGALHAHHPTWTSAELVEDFQQARSRLEVMDGTGAGVAAALEMSVHDLNPGQRHLFTMLGAHPGTEYEAGAAAALLDTGTTEARRLLVGLEEHRLLTETAIRGRFRMHDLTREHAAALAAAAGTEATGPALERLYGYYQNFIAHDGTSGAAHTSPWDREHELFRIRTERENLLACIAHADRHQRQQAMVTLSDVLAPVLEVDGPWAQAATLHSRAAAAAENTDTSRLAKALNNLGRIQCLDGRYIEAIGSHIQAAILYEQLAERHGQAVALTNLGWAVYLTNDYPQAVQLHTQALELFQQLGDRHGQAGTLNALGSMQQLTGDHAQAAAHHQRALELYEQLGNRHGQAEALNELGNMRRIADDYPSAAEHHIQALELYEQLGDRLGQAEALNVLGTVRRLTGDYPAAAEHHTRALQLYQQLGYRRGQAHALNALGRVQVMTDAHAQAAEHHAWALEVYEQLGDRLGQANSLNGLGECARRQGFTGKAKLLLRQALEIYQDLGTASHANDVTSQLARLG